MSSYKRNWLTKRDIYRKPGELYLTRYVIFQCKLFGIYVHKFWVSDYDVPHDHPWDFISMPLTKGYTEHLPGEKDLWRGPLNLKFRKAEAFHWVELNKGPMWTFFMRFKARRRWGFLLGEELWIDHDDYNQQLGNM